MSPRLTPLTNSTQDPLSHAWQKALEWDKLIELAQKEARTEPGKLLLESIKRPENWASEISSARQMQLETQEITPLLDRDALWGPLFELRDPSDLLDRLERGSILEIVDLALLRRWLYAVDSWTQIPRDEMRGEHFKKTLISLPEPLNILKILDRILTPQGELSEKASPPLTRLFSEIRTLKREISVILDQLLKTLSQKGVLQENFTDVRDGRYVLPVKISCQGEIDGIIYEASASHQTVFVEPREVAALNNKLRQRQNDLIQEIYIVLEATSHQLQPFVHEMNVAILTLCHWDSVQAKARLARHYAGKTIQVTEDRTFFLHQTAHPLLWWSLNPDEIIRNKIEFGQPARTLLLTGPNTGGKTVLLKTLGLAGICARTGFPFPATDQPIIPFFDSFFADLGDAQSIEHHLSSFSGHVLRFKEIIEKITDKSLILIDELNSATDPDEGAAFGRAVLETIMARNAMIVTTTHDPHLKALAVSDFRIVNASMAFDENARTPTYKMLLGIPGRSRALETAERLGIPPYVIELAKKYLSSEHIEFEKLLAKLESDTQEISRARKQTLALREEADRLKSEWTLRTEASVHEMMERTRQRLKKIIEQAQDEVRTSVRKLDQLKTHKDLDQARSQFNEIFHQTTTQVELALGEEAPEIAYTLALKKEPSARLKSTLELKKGMTVRIPKWKSTGTILEVSGTKIKVSMGTMQILLSAHEVEATGTPPQKNPVSSTQISGIQSFFTPPHEIDLRGTRLEEAMNHLEQYLDLAFRSGNLAEVKVIHGLGTGALREGTLRLLGRLPYIKAFRNGGAGQGGTGTTFVEFDRD